MLGVFLIVFREGLEAALIAAIILAYLRRTERQYLTRYVWYGLGAGIASSIAVGLAIWFSYGRVPESAQTLFEGAAALVAVGVLTSMILWMATRGREIKVEVERRVGLITSQGRVLGLLSFSFVVVFREGLETVLFLTPFLVEDPITTLGGAALGVASATVLGYALFSLGMGMSVHRLFYFTSILLILLAGGLMGYGTHELIEYAKSSGIEIGWFGDNAYALDIPAGSILHHRGAIGSILAVMLGYTVRAEWGRVVMHLVYLATFLPAIVRVYSRGAVDRGNGVRRS